MTIRVGHGLLAGIEYPHDGGMRHASRCLRLLAEAGAEGGVGGQRRFEQLDGDGATEAGVGADVHIGHASAADQRANAVPPRDHTAIFSQCLAPISHSSPFHPQDLGYLIR